jgi:hypothetical protein
MKYVYAVVFSNYDPDEIDTLWTRWVDAQERANSLTGTWQVRRMNIYEKLSELDSDAAKEEG